MKILLFGIITDITGKDELSLSGIKNTDELDKKMQTDFPELKKVTYRIAVNKEMINENTILKDDDEIAFMPPFAGG